MILEMLQRRVNLRYRGSFRGIFLLSGNMALDCPGIGSRREPTPTARERIGGERHHVRLRTARNPIGERHAQIGSEPKSRMASSATSAIEATFFEPRKGGGRVTNWEVTRSPRRPDSISGRQTQMAEQDSISTDRHTHTGRADRSSRVAAI